LKVMETIGQENVQLNPKQVNEMLDLLDKEEILEIEEKIEKVLKKEQEQRQVEKELKTEKDLAENEAKYNLQDNAKELGDEAKTNKLSEDEIDPKIKKVVEHNNEKILSQIPPTQPPAGAPTSPASGSPKPKDKVI